MRSVEVNIIFLKNHIFYRYLLYLLSAQLYSTFWKSHGEECNSLQIDLFSSRSRELHWVNTTFKTAAGEERSFEAWTKSLQNLAKVSSITEANYLKGFGKKEVLLEKKVTASHSAVT